MLRYFYTFIYYLAAPLLSIRWLYKSFQPPQYREPMRERFGFVARQDKPSIWFHAVSMGEASAAINLINKLLLENPELNIVVTTTTPTGARLIKNALNNRITHHYTPCDLPGTIKRFSNRIHAKLLVILETELWPNWLHYVNKKQIPIVLANARLSEKSADQYKKISSLSKQMMTNLSKVLAVNEADGERFLQLGLQPEKLLISGNVKYDISVPELQSEDYFPLWQQELVWIAASTHKGEDELILQAHGEVLQQIPNAKLILVPRHPERFEQVGQLIQQNSYSYLRRSDPSNWRKDAQVLLGDTMGELMQAFSCASVAFMGGSLVPIGGHNAIEPAVLGKPVITGPYIHNFSQLFEALIFHNGAQMVDSSQQLSQSVLNLLVDVNKAKEMGENAKKVILSSQGALEKTVKAIQEYI